MHIPKRRKLFVDPAVQGAMLKRALIYWAACLLFMTLPFLIGKTLVEPQKFFFEDVGDLWQQVGPVLLCAIFALPLLLYDMVQLTNRFAGPMHRLRREMRHLANGEKARRVNFRDGDFWHEFATYFNQIADRVEGTDGPRSAQKQQTPREESAACAAGK